MGYHEVEAWGGLPRWECDEGDFESTREALVAEHAEKAHVKRIRVSPVLGPDGKQIETEVHGETETIPETARNVGNNDAESASPAEPEESDSA